MENAVRYLIEPLLTQFFLMDAICRGFIGAEEKQNMLRELARVFCVPMDGETQCYFDAAGQFDGIVDYSTYERLCRTIEFAELSGQSVGLTAVDRVVLAQKREAMLIKAEIFKQSKNLTAEIIADTLLNKALNGNIDAMVTLSFMEYHGICICADAHNAVKRLALCAKWNNIFGNLMGIAYDGGNSAQYYDTLYTVLRNANQREIFLYLCRFTGYAEPCRKQAVARIIEKAFGLGIIKRNEYDQIFAKIAFSEIISAEDKEKLLLSKKKDAVASLSDIPFDADRSTRFSFDRSRAANIPLGREKELDQILCSLSPAIGNRTALYRTLLIAGEDEYVTGMYARALKSGFSEGNKVIEVDAGTLSDRDFAGGKENFLLRGLSETKQSHTVFFVEHCEELGQSELEELIKLLDYGYRRRFKLLEPTVSLDLSDVLLVLFASEMNAAIRELAGECDMVRLERLSAEEKGTVIETAFRSRSKAYGIENARLDEEGKKFLAPMKAEQIMRAIDGALKKAAYEDKTVITSELLKAVTARQSMGADRREFGYLGGVSNEEY